MRRPRKSINQINVVPYIDVMLVLLVIFMVTAPLITPGEIELPSVGSKFADAGGADADHAQRRQVAFAGRWHERARGARIAIRAGVAPSRRSGKNPGQAVVIAAKGTTQYKDVIDIVDLLQRNQIQKVGLLARQQSN